MFTVVRDPLGGEGGKERERELVSSSPGTQLGVALFVGKWKPWFVQTKPTTGISGIPRSDESGRTGHAAVMFARSSF